MELIKYDPTHKIQWIYNRNGKETGDLFHVSCFTVDASGNVYIKNDVINEERERFEKEQIIKINAQGVFDSMLLDWEYDTTHSLSNEAYQVFWGLHIHEERLYFTCEKAGFHLWSLSIYESETLTQAYEPKSLEKEYETDRKCQFGHFTFINNYFISTLPGEHGLVRYDRNTHTQKQLVQQGVNPGQLITPWYLVKAPDSTIFVGEHGNPRIQEFNVSGQLLQTISLASLSNVPFITFAMDYHPDGYLVVLDRMVSRLHCFNLDGSYKGKVPVFPMQGWNHLWILISVGMVLVVWVCLLSRRIRHLVVTALNRLRTFLLVKQLALFIPLLAVGMILLGLFIYNTLLEYYTAELEKKLLGVADSVASNIPLDLLDLLPLLTSSDSKGYKELHAYMIHSLGEANQNLSFALNIVQGDRLVRGVTKFTISVMDPVYADNPDYYAPLRDGKSHICYYQDISNLWNYIAAVAPVRAADGSILGLLVIQQTSIIFKEIQDRIFSQFLMGLSIILLVFIVGFSVFSIIMLRPLRMLATFLLTLPQNNYQTLPQPSRIDEIGSIIRVYNQVMDQLQEENSKRLVAEDRLFQSTHQIHNTLKNKLEAVQNYLDLTKDSLKDKSRALELLARAQQLVSQCNKDSKNILFIMNSKQLNGQLLMDEIGFRADLMFSMFSIDFESRTNPSFVETEFTGLQLQFFLDFVDEVFHNIRKHSKASEVVFSLVRDGRKIAMAIEDNGVGFDVASRLEQASSYGLSILHRLVHAVGGDLEVVSAPGKGTRVLVWLDWDI